MRRGRAALAALLALMGPVAGQASADGEYHHPGGGNFLEAGAVRNFSAYGYAVNSPYLVPRFFYGPFELMQSHVTYFALNGGPVKAGPMVNYVFTPYSGSEIERLSGMERGGYLEGAALAEIALPLGRLELTARYPFYAVAGGMDFKANYATALPLFKVRQTRSWLNLQYELTRFSSQTATYFFGVYPGEATPSRPAHALDATISHSLVVGHWFPVSERFWLTATFKRDWYPADLLKSPIVTRTTETSYLAGLLYSFE